MKNYPIDFIRCALEQTLTEQNRKYPSKYIGGENQVILVSFYEQVSKDENVNRYVERYREISEQANRLGMVMNGIINAPENPSITNLFSSLVIPMTFTCSFRCLLKDRDLVLDTINNLIDELKGTKVDIAEFFNGKLFKVGTLGENGLQAPSIENGDFLKVNSVGGIANEIARLVSLGLTNNVSAVGSYVYYDDATYGLSVACYETQDNITAWYRIVEDNSHPNILFPNATGDITRYKLSLSFDSVRCDEPKTLNGDEQVLISFGGSATLVNAGVRMGNDLIKVAMKRYKVVKSTDQTFPQEQWHYFEPLELPSGNSADTQANNLISNNFLTNTHTDSLSVSLQYSFIIDFNETYLKNWFYYARYGTQTFFTPNIIYSVVEWWSEWGEIEKLSFNAKIVESIDIENTESDTLSMVIPLQIQGDNN